MNPELYKVIAWSSGRVGGQAVRTILSDPRLELVGLWVSSDEKAGCDAGELCGVAPCGVIATRDVDALLALGADCVVYTATDTFREEEVIADLCRILRAGVNVVSTSFAAMVEPSMLPDERAQLEAACKEGQASIHFVGIHPGFALDLLPALTATLVPNVQSAQLYEMWNVAAYDDPFILREVLGFGFTLDEHTARHEGFAWAVGRFVKPAITMLGRLLGTPIDDIAYSVSALLSDEAFDAAGLHIAPGTAMGTFLEFRGMSSGRQVVTLREYLCVGPDGAWPSAWPSPPGGTGGYGFVLDGDVPIRIDMSFPGDAPPVLQAVLASGARTASVIPTVCQAPAGLHTFDTLTHVVGTLQPDRHERQS
jgi:4-hydroxy-tetrahydrodipicolinate reductase